MLNTHNPQNDDKNADQNDVAKLELYQVNLRNHLSKVGNISEKRTKYKNLQIVNTFKSFHR